MSRSYGMEIANIFTSLLNPFISKPLPPFDFILDTLIPILFLKIAAKNDILCCNIPSLLTQINLVDSAKDGSERISKGTRVRSTPLI